MGKVSVVSLLSCLLLLRLNCVKSNTPLAPALYVFGDSLVDGGNNNYLQSYAKANYPPYGKSFWNGQASGRFTNGKTPTDYIAEFLKLPWPPAILSLSDEWRKKTITGVNYASAGCGIIPETGVQLGCMNFDKQIDLFTRTVNNDLPNQYKTSKELSDHLAKSIFVVIIGSNDYLNYYLMAPMKSKHITSKAFATSLIGELSNRLEKLYQLGARKITVHNIGPIGCMPLYADKKSGKCVKRYNRVVTHFNARLSPLLKHLQSLLPGSIYVQGDTYKLSTEIRTNPSKYGFKDTSRPCCITETTLRFCAPNSAPCNNPDQYMFWDDYHPTQAMNSFYASSCFNGSSTCTPFNIQQLVSAYVSPRSSS